MLARGAEGCLADLVDEKSGGYRADPSGAGKQILVEALSGLDHEAA